MRKRKEPVTSQLAVGYVRVSTTEQAAEGVSLEAQEARLRAYCVAQGLELVSVLSEEAVSGTVPIAKRPQGLAMLSALESGSAHHVVALKLDRLFRDAADALTVTKEWDQRGVALHLVDMGGSALNTGSGMGRMFLTIAAGFAELERSMIAERTSSAMRHKALRGEVVSRAPRGYLISGKHLVPDPNSDGMIERVLALRASGLTLQAIADQLTSEGFRGERGGELKTGTLSYMLRNPRLKAVA